jgi:hypothetical protein
MTPSVSAMLGEIVASHPVQREHAVLGNIWDQVSTKTPGAERFMRRPVDDAETPDGCAALVDTFAARPYRRVHRWVGSMSP